MKVKEYLKIHPEKYILVTYEFNNPVYIAPVKNLEIQITDKKDQAQIWSSLDNTNIKLQYHIAKTGYKGLKFEQI